MMQLWGKFLAGAVVIAIVAGAWSMRGGLTLQAPQVVAQNDTTAEQVVAARPAPASLDGAQLAQADLTGKSIPDALNIQENDRVLGDMNAPVTIVEYFSYTCPHCGRFHNETLPEIKKAYVDTGKVKVVVRDLPWDNASLAISKINRCAPVEQHYALMDAFMRTQEKWLRSADVLAELKQIALLVGMTDDKVNACITDEALQKEVLDMKHVAVETLNVRGTPAFFVNGVRVEGARDFDYMKKMIDAALAQVSAPKQS